MAGTSTAAVVCVKCKKPYETEVVEHIDLSQDRGLAKSLKTGKANRAQCPKCKKVMYLDRSIVINFEPDSLIVVFDPAARKKAIREDYVREYNSVISFSEVLEEIGEETEFKVISDVKKLGALVSKYLKEHS
jgi:hypothetical protein